MDRVGKIEDMGYWGIENPQRAEEFEWFWG
jgi:hypothetical protein